MVLMSLALLFLTPTCHNSPGGSAIVVYKFRKPTFIDAQSVCQKEHFGGEIVTILDDEYNSFIQQVGIQSSYIR